MNGNWLKKLILHGEDITTFIFAKNAVKLKKFILINKKI